MARKLPKMFILLQLLYLSLVSLQERLSTPIAIQLEGHQH